jgi:hypothetical protein
MGIDRISIENRTHYNVSGVYDFNIEPNAIVSDQARFEAIRQGAQKGIDNFVAQVAAQGARLQDSKTIFDNNNTKR